MKSIICFCSYFDLVEIVMTGSDKPPSRRSYAQVLAARTNGAKSQGPVSEEGKEVACKNAFVHGLTAERLPVAAGEDGKKYQALILRLVDKFAPEDDIQLYLVRKLASIMWRTGRAEQLEADVLSFSSTIAKRGGRQVHVDFDADRLRAVLRYSRDLELAFYRTLTALGVLHNPIPRNEPGNRNNIVIPTS